MQKQNKPLQKQNKPLMLALLAGLALSGAAHAGPLIGRDLDGNLATYEAYYDTALDITWLANANMNGYMAWTAANAWADSLSFTDGVNVYANWRLPISDTCSGFNCTGSEMGHLFYNVLGGTATQSILTSGDPDLLKFTNLQANHYWSATEYAPDTGNAWFFSFAIGRQFAVFKTVGYYALAVSPGDVGAANNNTVPAPAPAPVSEPQTLALLGLGLLGLALARRRG